MLGGDDGTVVAVRPMARIAALVLGSLCAWASLPAPAASDSADQPAVWVEKEINFRYVGFTTRYTCDGLHDRMRRILLWLGARDDLRMTGYGCLGTNAPETTPGVRIVMHVLQPANATAGQTVAAHWKRVDLLAAHDLLDTARDCELISQLDRQVLPLFAARDVDYSATCSVHTPLVGGTRLKVNVLVADSSAATASP